ncbi:MAG TPA: hypothetical protein VM290_07560 [Gaiellaceae bacterium]|nr:hypothetical protein [Gaiellaceae bacterium]
MAAPEDIWLPLVDEPIGSIVDEIQAAHPDIDRLVNSPHRILAFKTFAYLRAGLLLGELLVDDDAPPSFDESWILELVRKPEHHERLVAEVRKVAEEVAADPRYADEEPLGPDDAARARFREFARKNLENA